MKYTITRQFSLRKKKFEIIGNSKLVCTVTATASKVYRGRFDVNLSAPLSRSTRTELCTVEPDSNNQQQYLIYIQNDASNDKSLFGQLSYETCSYDNYLYTIIIGKKLYKVRSCDLKDRRLTMIDTLQTNLDPYSPTQCPETLFQMIDSFSKSNKTYHVTINDKEKHLGYLAIVILLNLHETKRH